MTPTASSPRSYAQRMEALNKAQAIRLSRAALKRRIARGETTVAQVLADVPPEALSWPVGGLVAAQYRWGTSRMRSLLAAAEVRETRPVGALTARQRGMLLRLLAERSREGERHA